MSYDRAEWGLASLDVFPFFLSPCWNRTTSLRMEASCKQRCNVVEQTPSRLRVAAHFVCSIYQSKADNEIYEWNKGSHRHRVNKGRGIHLFISLFLKGVQKQLARTGVFSHQCIQKASQSIGAAFWGDAEWCGKRQEGTVGNKIWSVLFNSEAVQTDRTADKKREQSFNCQEPSQGLFFISHQMCEHYPVRIYAHTRAQRSRPSRRSRWSQAERAVVGRR